MSGKVATNRLQHPKRKISPMKVSEKALDELVVVGNYKTRQLDWIKKNGVYNYPVRDGDEFTPESFAKIRELWLYANVKSERHVFTARFVGKMTKAEFLAAYPSYAKLGPSKQKAYYVFTTKSVDYPAELGSQIVIARAADFGGYSAKVKKAIVQFKQDGEFAPLAAYLPKELGKVPLEQLRVCEAAVQLYFWNMPNMKTLEPQVPFPATENPKFTFIDLFAGIGGFRIAMQRCGGKCVFTSEFDAYAQKTYEANFGDVPAGDITKQETHDLIPEKFDVVCAGFPCQAFSLAGKRLGFDDLYKGMSRGTLFAEVVKICEKHRPKAVFCENVKGLFIHDKGNTFKVIKSEFEAIGYKFFYKILNSKDFGVPQHRERIYMVAFRDDYAPNGYEFEFPHPTGTNLTLNDIRERNVSARYYLSDVYVETLKRHRARHEAAGHGFGYVIRDWNGTSGAIVCGGMGRETNLVKEEDGTPKGLVPETHIRGAINKEGIRKMTPREWARLQGFPENFKLVLSDVHLYKQFGNSVSIPVIEAISKKIVAQIKSVEKSK